MLAWTAEAARWFTRPAHGLANLLYPSTCLICGAAEDNAAAPPPTSRISLCSRCRDAVVDSSPACPRCGGPSPQALGLALACPACHKSAPRFDALVRLGRYDGLLRAAVLKAKRADAEPLAGALARLLAAERRDELTRLQIDWIVPVPMHWTRRFARGVNGAEAIARALGGALSAPVKSSWLKRTRATEPQAELSPAQRRVNVRRAFRARQTAPLADARILLVDDVVTTGATASAATRALRRAGARFVAVAALARTPPS